MKLKAKLKHIKCPICNSSKNYQVIYRKNFKLSDFNVKIFSARRLPDKIHYQMVKCNQCGLVRSTPIVDLSNLNNLYKESLLTYNDEIESLTASYIGNLASVLKTLPKSASILEIGCGNGFILKAIYDLGYKNVFGVEPSTDAVNKANSKIKKNIKVSILKTDLFDNKKFDFIFFFQTFDHIPDPNKFLKLCYKLLNPGGKIFAFNHNIDSLTSKILKEKSPIIDIEHTFLYSPKTFTSIFQKNGFIVDEVYSPLSILTIKHLCWLIPMPKKLKLMILNSKLQLLNKNVKLKLGNICLKGHKK